MIRTHGTQLRHLIELLDGAVDHAYAAAGLEYRPRYTPVMRSLMKAEPATIGFIAEVAGMTQPAATQTIALMLKDGLISVTPGVKDGRQKMISLSPQGRALIPALERCWQATAIASASLEADLPFSLSEVLERAIKALDTKPFGQRIEQARAEIDSQAPTFDPSERTK
jgi:DNA-binding MarR family transcriptional regulator